MKLSPRYDVEVLTIEGRPDDQGETVRRQRRRMESLLAGLTDEQWRSPSRCAGWTVQDVIAHLVGVNAFWETSVSAGLSGAPTQMLANFDPAAHPPLLIESMRTLAPRETYEQFVASNDGFLGVLAALDDDEWSTAAESPAGRVSIRLLAFHALWDSWVHERDIAIPLGLPVAEEPDEIASCLRYAAAAGPVLMLDDDSFAGDFGVVADNPRVAFTLTVDDAVAIRNGPADDSIPCLRGGAVDLVEALSIRAALPRDAPAEWEQLVKRLATVFDTDLETTP